MMQEHNQDMFTACRKPKHWHPTKSSSAISWDLQFFVDSIDGTAVKPYYQSASTLGHFHVQHGPWLLLIYAYTFQRLSYFHTTVLKLEPYLHVLVLQWNFVTEWILAVNGKHTARAITVCTVHTLLDRTARKKNRKVAHKHSSQASKPLRKQVDLSPSCIPRLCKHGKCHNFSPTESSKPFNKRQDLSPSFLSWPCHQRKVSELCETSCSVAPSFGLGFLQCIWCSWCNCLPFLIFSNTLQGRTKVWCSLVHWTWQHAAERVLSRSFCSQHRQFYGNVCHIAVQCPHPQMQNLSE